MLNDLIHDGTGQNARMSAALDPSFFQLDERSSVETLAYAQKLSQLIRYFDLNGEDAGDWELFLSNAQISTQDIAAYQNDPSVFADDLSRLTWLSRPHFVLFNAFLDLLDSVKTDMNQFTARHLDYYYQDVLGFKLQAAEADSVYLLAELASKTTQYLLPQGTLLQAGKDADGLDRRFETTESLLVNGAKIAELRTSVVDWTRLSLAQYYQNLVAVGDDDPIYELLKVVYGDADGDMKRIETDTIDFAKALFDYFTGTNTYLSLSEWRKLYSLRALDQADDDKWGAFDANLSATGNKQPSINAYLNKAATLKSADYLPNTATDIRDFVTRFEAIYDFDPLNHPPTTDNPFAENFQGVEDIFDFYEQLEEQLNYQATRNVLFDAEKLESFKDFIDKTLFMPVTEGANFATDFREMMPLLMDIQTYWAKINRLIKKAGAAKTADYNPNWVALPFISNDTTLSGVERRLHDALGLGNTDDTLFDFEYPLSNSTVTCTSLDDFHQQLRKLAFAFYLTYEEVQVLVDNATNANVDDKSPVFALLDKASTKKQTIKNPNKTPIPPVKTFFNGFYAQNDATKNTVDNGGVAAWETFGVAAPPQLEIGFALQSDLLFLGEGERTITLDLVQTIATAADFNPLSFNYLLSTEKDWFEGAIVSTAASTQQSNANTEGGAIEPISTTIELKLSAQDPAIAAPPQGLFNGDPNLPVLKIILKEPADYWSLKDVRIQSVKLAVSVKGLTPSALENDNGEINPKKPYQPFGSMPSIGSNFFFGHRELFKSLDELSFDYTWKGIIGDPTLLDTHYANYSTLVDLKKGIDSSSSVTNTALLSIWNQNIEEKPPLSIKLFNETSADAQPQVKTTRRSSRSTTTAETNPTDATEVEPIALNQPAISMPETLSDWTRYFRLALNLDLLQNSYSGLASQMAMQFSVALQTNPATCDASKYQLNPPYTPEFLSFKVNYTTEQVTLFDATTQTGAVCHLYPFGQLPLQTQVDDRIGTVYPTLLPDYTDEGNLYIALSGCTPPQQITILFQVAEGSANPDVEKPPLSWSYLNRGGWQIFNSSDFVADDTNDFSNSGIVILNLPADATTDSSLMPQGFHWLKISVPYNRDSVCDMIAIQTQAVRAQRILNPNSTDDPGIALPPNTITDFYERQAGIKSISQPYASFGGKSAESNTSFLPRVSERLRHRERALTAWDVERLVLAHFPDVYKAKCLFARGSNGEVPVILIPDIHNKDLYDAFKPKMPLNRLQEIGDFLNENGSLTASFRATNPVYVELQVKAYVQFRAGVDNQYYLTLLGQELTRFLAPWAYDEGADIVINSTIYPSVIVNFMEERPYVDYVAELTLFKSEDGGVSFDEADENGDGALQAEHPESVWVSAKAHFIYLADTGKAATNRNYTGIGYMQIGYDFVVAGQESSDSRHFTEGG